MPLHFKGLMCAQKLTCSQLSQLHDIKTKNKFITRVLAEHKPCALPSVLGGKTQI